MHRSYLASVASTSNTANIENSAHSARTHTRLHARTHGITETSIAIETNEHRIEIS